MTMNETGDSAFTARSPYGLHDEATYAGALSFLRRPYTRDLEGADVVVTGIPFDLATTNRPGARLGPRAVRAASTHLSWGPPWPWGFDPTKRLAIVDAGDCMMDHGRPEGIPACIERHAAGILDAGASMLAIGGDHFITLPLLLGACEEARPPRIGALRRPQRHMARRGRAHRPRDDVPTTPRRKASSTSPDRCRSEYGPTTKTARDSPGSMPDGSHEHGPDAVAEETRRIVGGAKAYLTFDVDCLDPAHAPGTGTPVTGGLTTYQAQRIVRGLGGIDFAAMDVVEVAPGLRRRRDHRARGRGHRPRLSLPALHGTRPFPARPRPRYDCRWNRDGRWSAALPCPDTYEGIRR